MDFHQWTSFWLCADGSHARPHPVFFVFGKCSPSKPDLALQAGIRDTHDRKGMCFYLSEWSLVCCLSFLSWISHFFILIVRATLHFDTDRCFNNGQFFTAWFLSICLSPVVGALTPCLFAFSQLVAMGMIIRWKMLALTSKDPERDGEIEQNRNVPLAEHIHLII